MKRISISDLFALVGVATILATPAAAIYVIFRY